MTSLYKILKSAKLGAGAAQDFHTAIMAQKMPFAKRSGAEHEYTGAVPVTFPANGQPLLDYLISGNEEHSGTPTPDSPIMPQGTGDLETIGEKAGQYKIPISSAGQTTPIYLGEVETTRKIKKLVLTGEETITKAASNPVFTMLLGGSITPLSENTVTTLSTHYQAQSNTTGTGNVGDMKVCIRRGYGTMYIGDARYDNITDFKSYLAAQYANGTPVTVWYVLATPVTGIANEPLMRIGDYADTVSHDQAGVSIPTANGSTTLDVETAVKPSEIYFKYKS